MSRHLILNSDGETIDAVLTGLSDADALLNLALNDPSGAVVAIDPETDTSAVIDNGMVKYSSIDGLVLIADDSPVVALEDYEMAEVTP